jgi:hypothetical protein
VDAHGASLPDRWCIADVRFAAGEAQPSPPERRVWLRAPFNDGQAVWQQPMADDVWRFDYQIAHDADADAQSHPDRVHARLAAQFGADVQCELIWLGAYTYRSQCLAHFRAGRVFFAGDAAHVMSPFGARGGNAGVQDAENLVWKLALVLQGRAPEALLDSYDAERRPAAQDAIRASEETAQLLGPSASDDAEAQARAILAWLGVEPGTAGTLRGVVFEDQGVGTMDLSVRLPGARVRVVETAATAVAGGTDAAWSFMLPAGTYTVEASLDGHVTATRSCEVTSGGTTWCSVGLFPVETMTPDAAVEAPDASSTADAGRPDSDAGRIPRDGAIVGAADTGPGAQPSGCACSAAARRGPDGGSLAMLVLVVSGCLSRARRRRVAEAAASRPACATGLALTGWTLAGWALSTSGLALGGSGCATEANAPGQVALTREEPASQPRVTTLEGAPVRVTGERELLLAGPDGARLGAPFVSPDARTIVVAPSDASALYAWDRGTESLVLLCASRHCGHEPRFFGERSVATRTPEQSSSAIPGDAFTLDGQPTTVRLGARARSGEVGLAWIEDETRVLVRIAAAARTLEDGGDRFVRAELSPDARFVAVTGLTGGIALHRLSDGARIELGAGGHAHFDPEGRALVFDRTTDDGHALLTADTYLVELAEPLVVRRLLATSRLETHPSISRIDPRGAATVALVRDGAIVLADIALD